MGPADARDRRTWVVVELSRMGEQRAEEGTLTSLFRKELSLDEDFPIFIPCISYKRKGKLIVLNMMEGYAFIATGIEESHYIALGHNSPYVKQVMTQRSGAGIPTLSTVTDDSLEEIRVGLQAMLAVELDNDMEVRVAEGPYRGLSGQVIGMDKEYAHVLIAMRSLTAIRRIPKIMLRPDDGKEEDAPEDGDMLRIDNGEEDVPEDSDITLEITGEEHV